MGRIIKNILLSIFVIGVLVFLGLITYKLYFEDNKPKNNTIMIYSDEANNICTDFTINCINRHVSHTIKTDNENPILLSVAKNNKVLFYDNGLYLYDLTSDSKTKLDINYKNISNYLINGFVYNSDTEHYYYDYLSNNKINSGEYSISPLDDNGMDYLLVNKLNKILLIDINNGNTLITSDVNNLGNYDYATYKIDEDYVVLEYCNLSGSCNPREIYSFDGKKIASLNNNEFYYIISDQENTTGGNRVVVYEKTIKNSYLEIK